MYKKFMLIPFIIGLVLGVVGIYFKKPDQEVVMKYPLPETADKQVYRDRNGVCYKYRVNKVDCDINENKLKPFPLAA